VFVTPLLATKKAGYPSNQALVQVASWVIGQFPTTKDRSTIETMLGILAAPDTSVETRCHLITPITKLAARFRCPDAVRPIFEDFATDCNFEIQQRVGEMRYRIRRRQHS
jgi:hypothetical protein